MIHYQLPNGVWYVSALTSSKVETIDGVVVVDTKSVSLCSESCAEPDGSPKTICISGPSEDVDSIINMLQVQV